MKEKRSTFSLVFIFLCIRPSPTIDATLICSFFKDFTPEQTNFCVKNPQVVAAISLGVNTGIRECEKQFKNHRWNCSSLNERSSFGQTRAVPGTREASFMSAIVAAGVAHAVTRECAKGNISSCSCDKSNEGKRSAGGWKWGGCSDDIEYGIEISNKFLDTPRRMIEKRFELQNRQNSIVAHEVVRNSFNTDCRCHGASGSCASRTCWKSLPMFDNIGRVLKEKYISAIKVMVKYVDSRHGKVPKFLVLPCANYLKPTKKKLVFLDKSPSYCEANTALGVAGTSGRMCDWTKSTKGGCEPLCCGRGYNKIEFIKDIHCNCLFYYCCFVQCETCTKKSQETICK